MIDFYDSGMKSLQMFFPLQNLIMAINGTHTIKVETIVNGLETTFGQLIGNIMEQRLNLRKTLAYREKLCCSRNSLDGQKLALKAIL